jgi:hypothetical protein
MLSSFINTVFNGINYFQKPTLIPTTPIKYYKINPIKTETIGYIVNKYNYKVGETYENPMLEKPIELEDSTVNIKYFNNFKSIIYYDHPYYLQQYENDISFPILRVKAYNHFNNDRKCMAQKVYIDYEYTKEEWNDLYSKNQLKGIMLLIYYPAYSPTIEINK